MGSFSPSGCEANPHGKGGFVRDLYDESTTKYTVPVLWDTRCVCLLCLLLRV
jgi:hypothetical protein